MTNIKPLITQEQIASRLQEMAMQMATHWQPNTLIVSLLKGGFVFTADLMRALHHQDVQPEIDFMTVSSYGADTISSGEVTIHQDIVESATNRPILLVDDILESGRTLAVTRDMMLNRGAAEVQIAVLLEKPGKRVMDVHADYVGFSIPDQFVVGYGLDINNRHRELPFIGVVDDGG